jgi:alanine dehydrogenase
MRICVPKELYPLEKRVILLPSAVQRLVAQGHEVFVQRGAGLGIGVPDEQYVDAGAVSVENARDLYGMARRTARSAGLIVKLKAPLDREFSLMDHALLLSMFHSEQNPKHVYFAGLQNLVVIEMEKITDAKKDRLIEQTRLTGEAGVLYALTHSKKAPADMVAVVLGYGNVSSGAIGMCSRLGIRFKILRRSEFKFVREHLKTADLLINGIAWPEKARRGCRYIVTREDIRESSPNLIVLDLSVDFPNPIETIKPTDYTQPYYVEEGRVHISIYGYPGLFPETSSRIYSEQTFPLVSLIAENGGLRGIAKRGPLGLAVARAVLDPHRRDWQRYEPSHALAESRIE